MEGGKLNNQKFRVEMQKTQNLLDKTDIRPMADHLDLFQHKNRDWYEKADLLTHESWKEVQTLKLSEHVLMEESASKKIGK